MTPQEKAIFDANRLRSMSGDNYGAQVFLPPPKKNPEQRLLASLSTVRDVGGYGQPDVGTTDLAVMSSGVATPVKPDPPQPEQEESPVVNMTVEQTEDGKFKINQSVPKMAARESILTKEQIERAYPDLKLTQEWDGKPVRAVDRFSYDASGSLTHEARTEGGFTIKDESTEKVPEAPSWAKPFIGAKNPTESVVKLEAVERNAKDQDHVRGYNQYTAEARAHGNAPISFREYVSHTENDTGAPDPPPTQGALPDPRIDRSKKKGPPPSSQFIASTYGVSDASSFLEQKYGAGVAPANFGELYGVNKTPGEFLQSRYGIPTAPPNKTEPQDPPKPAAQAPAGTQPQAATPPSPQPEPPKADPPKQDPQPAAPPKQPDVSPPAAPSTPTAPPPSSPPPPAPTPEIPQPQAPQPAPTQPAQKPPAQSGFPLLGNAPLADAPIQNKGKSTQGVVQTSDVVNAIDTTSEQLLILLERMALSLRTTSQRLSLIESILDRSE